MNYYVKRTDESGIEGPFTVEQINQMFRDKLLDLNSTGIADTGQDIRQIASSKKGWINLIHVRGVTGHFPNHVAKRNSLLEKLAIAVFILVLILLFGYMLLIWYFKGIQ
jgi:hypothetical protein